jgi:hypothetical protein
MTFWNFLKNQQPAKLFYEKDNLGTRQDTLELANGYWKARHLYQKIEPYVIYVFEHEKDAREALESLACIHTANDTRNLICTETLIFGYYKTDDGKYEAIICGEDLSHKMWESAIKSFTRYNGKRKNDLEPVKKAKSDSKTDNQNLGKIIFIREYSKMVQGQMMIYRIYKGPNAALAKDFLEKNPVAKEFYYLVVETPEGNYCRDNLGMYKE